MKEADAPERKMKRSLNAFDLTCLGIGAIIGAGIFALAGTAAAGEQSETVASLWKTPILNYIQSFMTHSDVVM
jgi:amino acid transporter